MTNDEYKKAVDDIIKKFPCPQWDIEFNKLPDENETEIIIVNGKKDTIKYSKKTKAIVETLHNVDFVKEMIELKEREAQN